MIIKFFLSTFMILAFLVLSNCASNDGNNLPNPIKLNSQPSSAKNDNNQSLSNTCKDSLSNLDVYYLCKISDIEIEEEAKKIISIDEAKQAIIECFSFLSKEFGSPPLQDYNINININLKNKSHAITKINKLKRRTIEINAININKNQRDYLLHELFHAFYQNDRILSKPINEVEAWATYAQYRYKYRGSQNSDIKTMLIDKFSISKNDLGIFKNNKFIETPDAFKSKAYVINIFNLLSVDHFQNYLAYRDLIYTKN